MTKELYPEGNPYNQGHLNVGDGHRTFYQEFGNPDGILIVYVHGGPGSGNAPWFHQFFDPEKFRIILFEQRGCGQSTPRTAETLDGLENNSPDHLVEDMEKLRQHLGVDQWHVYGGSWGVTLALLYGQKYPERVSSFILRGVFLMQSDEIDHFINGMGKYYPEAQKRFVEFIPEEERSNLLEAYYKRLMDPDPNVNLPAAHAWNNHEGECYSINCDDTPMDPDPDDFALCMARTEAHFFYKHKFQPDDRILGNIGRIAHIPTVIVQGEKDAICEAKVAQELAGHMHNCELHIVHGGHNSRDPELQRHLLMATDNIANYGVPNPKSIGQPRRQGNSQGYRL